MSSDDDSSFVTVSACGKVLLVGGYLVLESPNVGLVLGVDKRFYTTIRSSKIGDDVDEANATSGGEAADTTAIQVTSPQFHTEWNYTWRNSTKRLDPSTENPSINPFVENSLILLCLYRPPPSNCGRLQITIQADNDFYSVLPHLQQQETSTTTTIRTVSMVSNLPKCLPCPKDAETGKVVVNKTGLGSSAALTTSLVGAWLECFREDSATKTTSPDGETDDDDDDDDEMSKPQKQLLLTHNLAQLCHCWAQGKIGSGFDVSAAVFGTHIYTRFSKCLLSDFLQQVEHGFSEDEGVSDNAIDLLHTLVEMAPWKLEMQRPLTASPNLQLVLADVCGGSESPSMAKLVIQWKQLHVETSRPIWSALQQHNQKVIEIMQQLSSNEEEEEEDYDQLSQVPSTEWPTTSRLKDLTTTFQEIRKLLKKMGDEVGVPIEPDEQTAICDATMALPGVVAAVVPGAGGYDAIACLYIDRPNVLGRIEELWASHNTTAKPSNGEESKTKVICPLGAKVSREGLRVETDWKV